MRYHPKESRWVGLAPILALAGLILTKIRLGQCLKPWWTLTLIGDSGEKCYLKTFYSENVRMNWTQAVDFCHSFGLQLASVESVSDQLVISEWAKDPKRASAWSSFWLSGGKKDPQKFLTKNKNCPHVDLTPQNKAIDRHLCSGYKRPLCMHKTNSCPETKPDTPVVNTAYRSFTTQFECNCGLANHKLTQSTEAGLGEFPWRCGLLTHTKGVYCGCTIINKNWVMTAAHCTNSLASNEKLYINIGDFDLGTNTETYSYLNPAERIVDHPLYNGTTVQNDISLIKLNKSLNFGPNVGPICLPFGKRDTLTSRKVTLSGWGSTSFRGPMSEKLNKAEMTVVDTEECRKIYGPSVTNNMLCIMERGKTGCNGDSGGSADLLGANGRRYAVGIVSYVGLGCDTKMPNVLTRVTSYLEWIVGTTGDEFSIP